MGLIIVTLLECVALILVGMLIISLWQTIKGAAPFVPIPTETLDAIMGTLQLSAGSRLYDLGSGDGRVLKRAVTTHPDVTAVGVDHGYFPYIIATLRRIPRTTFLRRDLFTLDLAPATHIFIYLFPEMVDRLLPKFQQELQSGTRVVSCDFPFSSKQPIQVVRLEQTKTARAHTLYVYIF